MRVLSCVASALFVLASTIHARAQSPVVPAWPAPAPLPSPGAPWMVAPPPRPLPRPKVQDFGLTQVVTSRIGYTSGPRLGGGIAMSYRVGAYGIDALQVDVTQRLDAPDIGFRISPFVFIFGLSGRSVWDGFYLRWSLVDFGADYPRTGSNSITFGTAFSVGYGIEVSDGLALRLFDIGAFGGGYARDGKEKGTNGPDVLLDWGATLGAGVTFR